MSTAKNIVEFKLSDDKHSQAALPPLLESAKQIAIKQLSESLDTLFKNTDDCLFEYADKATDNEQQTSYLHAMREIGAKKAAVTKAYFEDFARQFDNELSVTSDPSSENSVLTQSDCASGMGLSLVDEDDLEESLALTNIANRIYSEYRESLSALVQRMNEVYEAKQIDKQSNPLRPEIICNAFSKAVSCLSISVEIKLILYKLFDKLMVRNIGKLYHDINEMFIAEGVLPTIKYKIPVVQSSLKSPSLSTGTTDEADSHLNELTIDRVNNPSDADYDENIADNPLLSTQPDGPSASSATLNTAANITSNTVPNTNDVFKAMHQVLNEYRDQAKDEYIQNDSAADITPASSIKADQNHWDFPAENPVSGDTVASSSDITDDSGDPQMSLEDSLNDASDSPVPITDVEDGLSTTALTASQDAQDSEPSEDLDSAVYFVTADVISGLSRIQNNAGVENYKNGSQKSGEVIKSKVVQIVQAHNLENPKSLNSADADIIDIVSMMFDFILNDKSLPDRSKAIIARLQIPMVKVAMLDRTFFGKKSHPARALLNELANASDGLDSEYKGSDKLFEEIERIVNRILNEFDSNIELFEELLTEFDEFQGREIQANRLAEQKILDTRQTVAEEIEKRLRNHKVPEAVSRFILGPWKDVMTSVGIKDQCEGIAWSSASTFLDDLIWSVQPKLFNDERRQLTMLIPRMLNALREGMALLKDQSYDLPGFLETLQKIHLDLLHVQNPFSKTSTDESDDFAAIEFDETSSWRGTGDDGMSPNEMESDPNNAIDNITLQGDKRDNYLFDIADPQLMHSRFFKTVKAMEPGTWVEFKSAQGRKRGKLGWKCDFTGEYTFLNSLYKVVVDIDMRDLINRMEEGSAKIVEDIPMFDRAVNAIMGGTNHLRS